MQKAYDIQVNNKEDKNLIQFNEFVMQKSQLEQKLFIILQKQISFQNFYNDGYGTQFRACLNQIEYQRLKLHQKLFDQDSSPEYFYIILKGKIGLFSKQKLFNGQDGYQYQGSQLDQTTRKISNANNFGSYYQVKVLGQGSQLGEQSILMNIHRCSSAIALEDSTILLRLNCKYFLQILKIREESKLFSNLTFIKECSSINFLSFNALKDIYVKSYSVRFQRDQYVCIQGAYPSAAFMIQSGEFSLCSYANINQNKSPPKNQPYQTTLPKYHTKQDFRMTFLGIKEIFGDIEILTQQNYAYSLKCESDGDVLIIPRYIYEAKVMQNDLLIDFVKNKSSQINQKRMLLYKKFTQNIDSFRHFMYDAFDTDEEDNGKIVKDKGYEIFKKTKKFKNLVKNEKQFNKTCQNFQNQDQNIKIKNQNYMNSLRLSKDDQNTSKQDNNKDNKQNNQNKMKELTFLENANCYELSNQGNNSFYFKYKGSSKQNISLNPSKENLNNRKISSDNIDKKCNNINFQNEINQQQQHFPLQECTNNKRKLSQQGIFQKNIQPRKFSQKLERSSSLIQSQESLQAQEMKKFQKIKLSLENNSSNEMDLIENMESSLKQDSSFDNQQLQNKKLSLEIPQKLELTQIIEKDTTNQSICQEEPSIQKEENFKKDGFYNQKDILKSIFYKNHPSRPSSKCSRENNKCRSFSLAPEKLTIEEQEYRNYNQDFEFQSQDNSLNISPFNSVCMSKKEREELMSQLSQRIGKDDVDQSSCSPNQKSKRPKSHGNKLTNRQQRKVMKLLQKQNQELFKLKIDPKVKIKIVGYDKTQNFIASYRESNIQLPRNTLVANQILKQLNYQPDQMQEYTQNIKEEQSHNRQMQNIGNNYYNQILQQQNQRRSKSSNTSRTRNISFSQYNSQDQESLFLPYQSIYTKRNQDLMEGSSGFYDQITLDKIDDSIQTPQTAISSLNSGQTTLNKLDTVRRRFNEVGYKKPQTSIPLPRRKGEIKNNLDKQSSSNNRRGLKNSNKENNNSFGTNQSSVSEIEGFDKSYNNLEVNGYDINQYRQERIKASSFSINIMNSVDQTNINSNTTALNSNSNIYNSNKNCSNTITTDLNTTTNGFTTSCFNTTQNGFYVNNKALNINKCNQKVNKHNTNSNILTSNKNQLSPNFNNINKTQNDFNKKDNNAYQNFNAQISLNNNQINQKIQLKIIETPFASRRSTFNCISQTTCLEDQQKSGRSIKKENNTQKQRDNLSIYSSSSQIEKSHQTISKKEITTINENKVVDSIPQNLHGNSIPLTKKEQRSSIPKQNTLRIDQQNNYQLRQQENDLNQHNNSKLNFAASTFTKARMMYQKSRQSSRNNSNNSRDQSQNSNQQKESDNSQRYISFDFRPPNQIKQSKN